MMGCTAPAETGHSVDGDKSNEYSKQGLHGSSSAGARGTDRKNDLRRNGRVNKCASRADWPGRPKDGRLVPLITLINFHLSRFGILRIVFGTPGGKTVKAWEGSSL